jgi:hypothetical protein
LILLSDCTITLFLKYSNNADILHSRSLHSNCRCIYINAHRIEFNVEFNTQLKDATRTWTISSPLPLNTKPVQVLPVEPKYRLDVSIHGETLRETVEICAKRSVYIPRVDPQDPAPGSSAVISAARSQVAPLFRQLSPRPLLQVGS